MCNLGCVEDEYHFILICPKYDCLREKYLPWRFRNFPSSAKFTDPMSSNNDQTAISLSNFIYQAFKVWKHGLLTDKVFQIPLLSRVICDAATNTFSAGDPTR